MEVKKTASKSSPQTITRRAWQKLSENEREWVLERASVTDTRFTVPLKFEDMPDTRRRLLYALCATGEKFTVAELAFLLIIRWRQNTDSRTIKSRLAEMVTDDDVRPDRSERYFVTPQGLERMHRFVNRRVLYSRGNRFTKSPMENGRTERGAKQYAGNRDFARKSDRFAEKRDDRSGSYARPDRGTSRKEYGGDARKGDRFTEKRDDRSGSYARPDRGTSREGYSGGFARKSDRFTEKRDDKSGSYAKPERGTSREGYSGGFARKSDRFTEKRDDRSGSYAKSERGTGREYAETRKGDRFTKKEMINAVHTQGLSAGQVVKGTRRLCT